MQIFLILLLGFVLRITNLSQSLWLDEAITAIAVKTNSFTQLITNFSVGDFHPPLYYLILKLWTNIFGYSEVALRVLSVIFGIITIFFVYKIGQKLFGQKMGLVAALIMATNPLDVYYSQEARMYSLAAMAITIAVWFFIQKKQWLFILFLTAAFYTDYLPLLIFPIFGRYAFPVILLLIPWTPFFITQLKNGISLSATVPLWSKVVGGFDIKALPLTFVKFIFGRISFDNKLIYGVIAGSTGAIYLWILSKVKTKILWMWLLMPLIFGFVLSLKLSVFSYFRFLFVLPAFVLLLSEGIKNNKFLLAVVLLIQFLSLIYFDLNSKFWREDWRSATKYMETDESLTIMPSLAQSAPLKYYGLKTKLIDINQQINLDNVKTVYLVRYVPEIFDPNNIAQSTIEKPGYKFVENKDFNGVVIWKYAYRN